MPLTNSTLSPPLIKAVRLEWHINFYNFIRDTAFVIVSRCHEQVVRFGAAFDSAGFVTVGTAADDARCDAVDQRLQPAVSDMEDPKSGKKFDSV